MEIYGITGMPLSGKTLAANIMQKEGFKVVDMGDIVRLEMDKRNLPVEKTKDFVNGMRDEHGEDAIARLTQPYLEEIIEENNKVIITGMRSIEEKTYFQKQNNQKLQVIALWSSEKVRKTRRQQRNRDEDIKGQKFRERDLREIQNGVGKLMALSDYLVKNEYEEEQKLENQIKKQVLEM